MNASHRAVMVSTESLLFILKQFILNYFGIVRRASEKVYARYERYFAGCIYHQIVNFTSVQSVKFIWKYFG